MNFIFNLNELYLVFSEFKKERIDYQYYIPIMGTEPITKDKCAKSIRVAKDFNIKLRVFLENLKINEIKKIREKFKAI